MRSVQLDSGLNQFVVSSEYGDKRRAYFLTVRLNNYSDYLENSVVVVMTVAVLQRYVIGDAAPVDATQPVFYPPDSSKTLSLKGNRRTLSAVCGFTYN